MYAHSIKNPDIRHYVIMRRETGLTRRLVYLCIRACYTTPSKRTRNIFEVTCKNCLRELEKRGLWPP